MWNYMEYSKLAEMALFPFLVRTGEISVISCEWKNLSRV